MINTNFNRYLRLFSITALFMLSSSIAQADVTADGIAKGDFEYAPKNLGSVTFNGDGGTPLNATLSITAPALDKTGSPANAFQHGNDDPISSVSADIRVKGIEKIVDADGNIIDQSIDLTSTPGKSIVDAININPINISFTPAQTQQIVIVVNNPKLANSAYYGDYEVKIKAIAPQGFGLGEGSGTQVVVKVRPAEFVDNTPPDVTISKPNCNSELKLDTIPISVTAIDPTPGTGVISLNASVASIEKTPPAVDEDITLTLDHTLPVSAGTLVTGDGNFVPTGATGSNGTTLATAFDSAHLSGIGKYRVDASATDGNNNTGDADSCPFTVLYKIADAGSGAAGKTKIKVKFSVYRNDNTFIFDKTVKVSANSSTHEYGAGAITGVVQIDETNKVYETQFESLSCGTSYPVEVSFIDVDGKSLIHWSQTVSTKSCQ